MTAARGGRHTARTPHGLAAMLAACVLVGACGCGRGLGIGRPSRPPDALPAPSEGPQVDLDVILTSADRESPWQKVVEAAQSAHPEAQVATFGPGDAETLTAALRDANGGYAMLVMPPEEIDVNFAWRLLSAASRLDDDPFVDVCYGIMTGATPDDAVQFLGRIEQARQDASVIVPRLVDCLGPNLLNNDRVIVHRRLFWAGWLSGKLESRGMNNGGRGFADNRLDALSGYGFVHFGGHGYPDRIDQGLTAKQVARLDLSPCVAFNGACSTGVTCRAFEMAGARWAEKTYPPEESFCLAMLQQPVVAYLAATHPDHGVPVYQEMEYLFTTGCALGQAIKRTYDHVVMGNGGVALDFPVLRDGEQRPSWGPKEIMLYGTASRLLYGDPTLSVTGALHETPLSATSEQQTDGAVRATVTVEHPEVAFSLMNTFEGDMAAQKNGFNDRVYVRFPLEKGIRVADVTATAKAKGREVRSRVVGAAVEKWRDELYLHVQVDTESSAYQGGPIRRKGATVELAIKPSRLQEPVGQQ